jgi:DNA polymerase-3 subunit beta
MEADRAGPDAGQLALKMDRSEFADVVAWTARTLPRTGTATSGIVIDASDGRVSLSSTDLEVSGEAVAENAVIEAAGRVMVSGRLLSDIARSLPEAPVRLVADSSRATISCGRAKFSIPVLPEADHPHLPNQPRGLGRARGDLFAKAVAQTYVATARNDSYNYMNGIKLELGSDQLTFAATDRYRLAVRDIAWVSESFSDEVPEVIVPGRSLSDVAKALAGDPLVQVGLDGGAGIEHRLLGLQGENRSFTTRLIDGKFPAFRSLIPSQFESTVRIDVAELSDAIKRVSLLAKSARNMAVQLHIEEGEVTLSVGGPEEGAEEAVEAELVGSSNKIAFNPQFLLDGLHSLDRAQVVISFNEPSTPVVLLGADADAEPDRDYRYLLMPIRIA